MKIAFYLDSPNFLPLAEKAIAAARETMPQAEIYQLSTEGMPKASADHFAYIGECSGFSPRRALLSSHLDGDTLFLDVDVMAREDVSGVFEDDFDVAVTTDIAPGGKDILYNAGVIFARCPEFFLELASRVEGLEFSDWRASETAFCEVVDSKLFNVKVLDGERYNRIPTHRGDTDGALIHYRGRRKMYL